MISKYYTINNLKWFFSILCVLFGVACYVAAYDPNGFGDEIVFALALSFAIIIFFVFCFNFSHSQSTIYLNKANEYLALPDYNQALANLNKCIELSTHENNNVQLAEALNKRGRVYQVKNEIALAPYYSYLKKGGLT